MKRNNEIYFQTPEDTSIVDFIYDILDKNNLREPIHAWLKRDNTKESRVIIIRDAALVLFQKKIPEEKLVEFLAKHLEASKETAEKVVQDIKEKLIPYTKTADLSKNPQNGDQKEKYREELLKKINANRNIPTPEEKETSPPYYKKIEIADVEKNAENMRKEGKNITTEEKSKFPQKNEADQKSSTQNNNSDTYREPIE